MKTKKYNLNNDKVKYLITTDEKLGKLIRYVNSCSIPIEEDDFKCIVKYIIGQQISDKMRESIWQKLCQKDITPETMANINDDELNNLGICRQKINYIKNLSNAILNNEINFKKIKRLTNEEITKQLTNIKGIGNWTVEMYLIFSLGRENVFFFVYHTIKRVIKWMYNLEELPTSKELETYFSKWLDYSTIVSAYFWEALAKDIISQNICDLH